MLVKAHPELADVFKHVLLPFLLPNPAVASSCYDLVVSELKAVIVERREQQVEMEQWDVPGQVRDDEAGVNDDENDGGAFWGEDKEADVAASGARAPSWIQLCYTAGVLASYYRSPVHLSNRAQVVSFVGAGHPKPKLVQTFRVVDDVCTWTCGGAMSVRLRNQRLGPSRCRPGGEGEDAKSLINLLPDTNFRFLRRQPSRIRQFDTWLLDLRCIVSSAWILTSVSTLRQSDNGHPATCLSVRQLWILRSAQ